MHINMVLDLANYGMRFLFFNLILRVFDIWRCSESGGLCACGVNGFCDIGDVAVCSCG